MNVELNLNSSPPSLSATQPLPVDTEGFLAQGKREDEKMLAWLDSQDGRHAYLGNILLEVQGCTKQVRNQFSTQGGFKLSLEGQMNLLEKLLNKAYAQEVRRNFTKQVERDKLSPTQLKKLSARIDSSLTAAKAQHAATKPHLIGAVIGRIKQTAAHDPNAPYRLRSWFANAEGFQNRHKKRSREIAMQLWPGERNQIQHDKFCAIADRLSFEKNLLDLLANWKYPRWLARALVNHVANKNDELEKAPTDVCRVVLNICSQHDMAEVVGLLWQLAGVKLTPADRKDKPAARLKQALEALFRFWEKSSKRSFVKEAWDSAAPWFLDSAIKKLGDKKELSRQLSDVYEKEFGKAEAGKFQTYTRYARS